MFLRDLLKQLETVKSVTTKLVVLREKKHPEKVRLVPNGLYNMPGWKASFPCFYALHLRQTDRRERARAASLP